MVGGTALSRIWLFIIAPVTGAVPAVLVRKYLFEAGAAPA
jgi:glycerol uptake facilitator-like aquaporin